MGTLLVPINMRLLNYFAPARDDLLQSECSSLMNFQTSTHRSAWLLTTDELVCCQSCIRSSRGHSRCNFTPVLILAFPPLRLFTAL